MPAEFAHEKLDENPKRIVPAVLELSADEMKVRLATLDQSFKALSVAAF